MNTLCWATTGMTARTAGIGGLCRGARLWGGRCWCTLRCRWRRTSGVIRCWRACGMRCGLGFGVGGCCGKWLVVSGVPPLPPLFFKRFFLGGVVGKYLFYLAVDVVDSLSVMGFWL